MAPPSFPRPLTERQNSYKGIQKIRPKKSPTHIHTSVRKPVPALAEDAGWDEPGQKSAGSA